MQEKTPNTQRLRNLVIHDTKVRLDATPTGFMADFRANQFMGQGYGVRKHTRSGRSYRKDIKGEPPLE